ncbi:MAG: hypothetical protein ACYC8T_22875 [Myxococcaceae bacterium]
MLWGLVAAGCNCGPGIDAPEDAGFDWYANPGVDAGAQDAGAVDAGPDGGPLEDGGGDSGYPGADAGPDAGAPDAGGGDSGYSDAGPRDAGAADAGPRDAGRPDAGFGSTATVHIYVSNSCQMTVTPSSFSVPAGETLQLSYKNDSAWYPVDIWKSYGGGYLDLQTGATWNEQYVHCTGPTPSEPYADISTACSSYRLPIHCL